jgi:hypothetical protein
VSSGLLRSLFVAFKYYSNAGIRLMYGLNLGKDTDECHIQRRASSGILRRVVPVRTFVSEDLSASIIRVTKIGELGTLAVTSN